MTGNDPADVGATHETDTDRSPATAIAPVGAPGGYTGGGRGLEVTNACGADHGPAPTAFTARI